MKEALRKLGSCFWKLDALTTKEGGFTSLFFFFCFCLPVLPFLRLSAKSRRSACAARAWTRPSNFEGEENEERVCQSESHDRSVSLECQRNSSGSPLQAPCESFLQGQENIQQLQHFRGVIPELFSFHRPQAEEDFQKTSRLSLPASLQRSSDSLAQAAAGESLESYAVFRRYYRQILLSNVAMRKLPNGFWRIFLGSVKL